jgi:exopolyphosphatase/guanosine-5'-triphosphate,3'-diphosphate pyrophosphatase
MEKIIPRWEYRVFAEDLGAIESKIRAHEVTREKESAEDYIVCRVSGNNVKVRDGLLDIKQLENVNDDTLEQWMPVMKVGFPCPADDVARIFSAFDLARPEMKRDEYTYDQFIDEVVGGSEELEVVKVTKKRQGFMIREVIVEVAEVTFDGVAMKTAAAEHIDPSLVMELVRELGLDALPNVNYIKAMKTAVGMEVV